MDNLGLLEVVLVTDHLDLVAKPTADLISALRDKDSIGVAEIDPSFSDTAAFCDHYKIDPAQTVNCVVVKAQRAGREWYAACAILATTKADVNGLIRRHLDARRVSFAPMDEAVKETGMEYGGITPIGLPANWPILVDSAVAKADRVTIGSGIRKSKLVLPGSVLASLPNAVVLGSMGVPR